MVLYINVSAYTLATVLLNLLPCGRRMAHRGSSKRSAIAIQNGAKKNLNKGISLGKEENEEENVSRRTVG